MSFDASRPIGEVFQAATAGVRPIINDGARAEAGAAPPAPPQRRRLVLKPRSKDLGKPGGYAKNITSSPKKTSIFGGARPREEILKSKGVDYRKIDADLDARTATLPRMSAQQTEEFNALESEINFCVDALKKVAEGDEDSRKKLQDELDKKNAEKTTFLDEINKAEKARLQAAVAPTGAGESNGTRPRFERPSERRQRIDEERRERGYSDDRDGTFSNFGRRGGSFGNDGGSFGNDGGSFGNGGGGGGGGNFSSFGYERRGGGRPDNRECHNCGEIGHIARNCPNARRGGGGGGGFNRGGGGRNYGGGGYGNFGGGFNNGRYEGGGGGGGGGYGGGGYNNQPTERYSHIDAALEGDGSMGAW